VIKSRVMRGAGHLPCARVLVGEPEAKRSLGRPRCRWEGNFEIDIKGTGWEGLDWIDLALDKGK
jgi:hypothetical protein